MITIDVKPIYHKFMKQIAITRTDDRMIISKYLNMVLDKTYKLINERPGVTH